VNGPVHAAATQQAVVGGVHDRVRLLLGDVSLNEAEIDHEATLAPDDFGVRGES
jgi:hypothetical protein